jgi:hypothetical protein
VANTGKYSGKGGTAIAYLLQSGEFEVVQQSSLASPSYEGFVLLRRMGDTEPGGERCMGGDAERRKPWDDDDHHHHDGVFQREEDYQAGGAKPVNDKKLALPGLEWIAPAAGGSVPCCTFQASLKVTNAKHGEHTVVIFVDHLEQFRWTGDGAGEGRGGYDVVEFEVAMERPKRFPLNAHVLSADLAILANSTTQVDLVF